MEWNERREEAESWSDRRRVIRTGALVLLLLIGSAAQGIRRISIVRRKRAVHVSLSGRPRTHVRHTYRTLTTSSAAGYTDVYFCQSISIAALRWTILFFFSFFVIAFLVLAVYIYSCMSQLHRVAPIGLFTYVLKQCMPPVFLCITWLSTQRVVGKKRQREIFSSPTNWWARNHAPRQFQFRSAARVEAARKDGDEK